MKLVERATTPPNGKASVWWNAVDIPPPWEGGAAQKDAVKAAGFWFDGDQTFGRIKRNAGTVPTKTWWTDRWENVLTLAREARAAGKLADVVPSIDLRERIEAAILDSEQALVASRAHDADVAIPLPSERTLFPFQRAGVQYGLAALRRCGGFLNGSEMGTGKTPSTLAMVNAMPDVDAVLVVCPKIAMMVWQRHAEQWLVGRWRIIRMQPGQKWPQREAGSKLFVVCNYDIVSRHVAAINAAGGVSMVIADEVHFLKNPDAQRTRAVVGKAGRGSTQPGIAARYRVGLTGTPIPNRVVETWPIISWLDPQRWDPPRGFFKFALRYCGAAQTGYGGAWDFTGASNLDEFQATLRSTVMYRVLKSDVLTELPPKLRTIVELDAPQEVVDLLARERKAFESWSGSGSTEAFTDLSRVRHEVGLAKVPLVVEQLRAQIDARGKAVCFGHHRDVLQQVADAFKGESVLVTGDTSTTDREVLARKFQTDPACRLFVGNMQAAGTAITLTASDYVAFAEEDWTPGNLTQAEDRCHRIGATGESVLVEHLVFSDSLDARMVELVIEKQRVAELALDAMPTAPPERVAAPSTAFDAIIAAARDGHPDEVVGAIVGAAASAPSGTAHAVRRALELPEGEPGTTPLLPGSVPVSADFLLGGNAYFTISDESGAWRYTYRISTKRGLDRPWFVGVLTGPDNRRDYAYAATIADEGLVPRSTRNARVPEAAPSMQVLRWALRHVAEGRALPDGYAVRHMDRCGMCGRALTTPESVDRGLGPECAGRLGA